jgi:CBS domain-containing protein
MTFFATVRRKSEVYSPTADLSAEGAARINSEALEGIQSRTFRSLAIDPDAIWEGEVTVQQIMSTNLATVAPDSKYSEIKKTMARQRLRHLLVTDVDGKLLGLISDRDLLRRNGIFAKQVMTRDPISLPPHGNLSEAISLMFTKRISCLPIVDGGRLIGILTTTDLIVALQCVLKLVASPPNRQVAFNKSSTLA